MGVLISSPIRHRINLRPIKEFVLERLDTGSSLRDVILNEKDEIPVNEFLVKVEIWLHLSRTISRRAK